MRVLLIGYGKMGRMIESLGPDHDISISGKINEPLDLQKHRIILNSADVAIEFSHPKAAFNNIKLALEFGIPVVSGTTGWLDQFDKIVSLCRSKNGAFFYASNFSIGAHIFFKINQTLAALMNGQKQYDVHIEEVHHVHKLDAPSGTAKTIASDIIRQLERKQKWQLEQTDAPTQLLIRSKRQGEVSGTHTIQYNSTEDEIMIRHKAHSRKGFATGAILAAKWLQTREGFLIWMTY